MAENKSTMTLKNLFKETYETNLESKQDITYPSEESLVLAIQEAQKSEANLNHSREIASNRISVRLSKGEYLVRENKLEEWREFATTYSTCDIPLNFEIESILKYLNIMDEHIYTIEEIANQFADEFKNLNSASTLFILKNIENFKKPNISFSKMVQDAMIDNNNREQKEMYQKLVDELKKMGIDELKAQILAKSRLVKLYENDHETAELILFENGQKEGVDNHGDWLFMCDVDTLSNRHMSIIFKVSKVDTIRYIVNRDTNIALITNASGTLKEKIPMKITSKLEENVNIQTMINRLESIITDIAVIDISHDQAYEIANEMIELLNPVNEDTPVLNVEEIYDQELKQLNKTP